jgi:hypothetical protein
MRYWWVNQNQTFRQEIDGGCLWSPKRNKNGNRNPFYEFMREVAPGDIVFSFCDTRIAASATHASLRSASSAATAERARSQRSSAAFSQGFNWHSADRDNLARGRCPLF